METIHWMYEPPKAGILANNILVQCLGNQGYYQVKHTPGLWSRVWRPISLALVVKNIGIVYVGREHADNLTSALKMYYKKIASDWEGTLYCGITMKWNDAKMIC